MSRKINKLNNGLLLVMNGFGLIKKGFGLIKKDLFRRSKK
ncbi:MAG: hypothetical protein Ct9H300mP18_03260 [Candidatus Neomarinimicrobiota bacterium]|jgi:hypothetical protein|nr:MAG: hypothetical protein Ct9H300mP18_03260 [Candidatus Neomarinimicrobiota bacterium]|tara:strand:- start:969 stop:1088 length:120 start_codon:yes stop_codon:yes gene_type:complete